MDGRKPSSSFAVYRATRRQEPARCGARNSQGDMSGDYASAATADTSAQTALRSVGLLNVLFEYACGGLGRAPCLERRLRRFATTTGEKCGLAVTLSFC